MKRKIFIVVCLMILLFPFNILAKEKIQLEVDKKNVKIGDELNIKAIMPNDFNSYAVMSTLKYDESVFEKIDDSNFDIDTTKMSISYNTKNNKFVIVNKSGEKEDLLFSMHLKVRENASSGETNIALTNITSSDGDKEEKLSTITTKVTIIGSDKEAMTANKIKEDNEKEKTTWKTTPLIIIILVVSAIVALFLAYLKYQEKIDKKLFYIIFSLDVFLVLILSLLLIYFDNRKDTNKDGNKNYEDTKEIIDYLIDIEKEALENKTESNKLAGFRYDIDGNGKLTIKDVANHVESVKEEVVYKADLTANKVKYYVQKEENLQLNFTAKLNYNYVSIKEVYVNGTKYKVQRQNNNYSFSIATPYKTGIQKYTITKVVLDNDAIVNVKNLTFVIDVLKNEPTAEVSHTERKNLNVFLKDNDAALQNARLVVAKGNNVDIDDIRKELFSKLNNDEQNDDNDTEFKTEIVYNTALDITQVEQKINNIDLKLGENYTIIIFADYDLDSEIGKDNYFEKEIIYNKVITNGTINIIPITNFNEVFPEQGKIVEFLFKTEFKPENMNNSVITKVVIDGVEKDVISNGDNSYTLYIDGNNTYGEKSHLITAVILFNGEEILCNYEVKYDVLKEKPQIENFIYHNKEGKLSFTINDKDAAVNDLSIEVIEQNSQRIISTKKLTEEEIRKGNIEWKIALDEGSKYDVRILGSYDLDSNLSNNKNNYALQYVHELIIYKISLEAFDNNQYYVRKGADTVLKFKVNVEPENNKAVATSVIINGKEEKVSKLEDGSYGVKVVAPNVAGVKEYKISKVILDDEEVSKNLVFKVDVLKDKPKIEDFYIDESSSVPKVIFTIKDTDNALEEKAGKIVIKDSNGSEKLSKTITKGNNTIYLNDLAEELKDGGKYYLNILLNYDLDSDLSNKENNVVDEVVEEYKDVEIQLYKASLALALDNNLYFNKDEIKMVYIDAQIQPTTVKIKSFVMDNNEEVAAIYEGNKLAINLKAPSVKGIKTFNIKKVILTNDIEIIAPLEIKIDVLKNIPYVNMINLSEENDSLSYELVDSDKALKKGTINIYDKTDKILLSENLKNSDLIKYKFQDEESYNVKIIGSYDLDSTDDSFNSVIDAELSKQTFMIGGAYNFKIDDVSITDVLQKGENPVVTFTSTNSRGAIVKKVTINDTSYEATQIRDNVYQVTLTNADKNIGKHDVIFYSIELDTGKIYYNQKDYVVNALNYTVLKEAPTIDNITVTNNENDKSVIAKFKINDRNLSLTGLTVLLVDSTGNTVATHEFLAEEIFKETDFWTAILSYNKNTDGNYTVKFLADYNLSDKHKFNKQNIGEASIIIENKDIYINNISPTKNSKYVAKGAKNFEISYEAYVGSNIKSPIYNNNYSRMSGVTVNGVNYIASQESGWKSKIALTAPNKAGVLRLTATRIQLELNSYYRKETNYYSVPAKDIDIEVLRDVPQISDLKISKEDYDKGTVTFDFNVKVDDTAIEDKEDGFYDGVIELDGVKHNIEVGANTITFTNVRKDEVFDLNFKASYDLDSDLLNENGKDDNEYENQVIYSVKYGLFAEDKYNNITLKDGIAISGQNNNYFEKDENIKLKFEIDNIDINPLKVKVKNKEYALTKVDDGYEFVLDGYKTFGEKTIKITDIIFENGKEVELEKPYEIKLEVLKDIPKIVDFNYEKMTDKIKATFDIADSDGAVIDKAKVIVTDDKNNIVVDTDLAKEITIKRDKDILRYYVTVIASYDRDIDVTKNSANYFADITLLKETISFDKKYIELKDINDINLYRSVVENGEEKITLIDEITIAELEKNKNDYFVEINMESMPSVRTTIKKIEQRDKHLILSLDYEYVTKENDKTKNLEIDFGEINKGKVINETHPDTAFRALLAKLEAGEDVTLKQNYDASSISLEGDTYVKEAYNGRLNGNGYTIENLVKPLFTELNKGAKIENLRLTDVKINAVKGTIASKMNGSTLNNVWIERLTATQMPYGTPSAALVGEAVDSTISGCKVTEASLDTVWLAQQVGAIVGYAKNTTIKNNYVTGKLNASWNFVATLAGNVTSSTIENNYTKVTYGNSAASASCGFACADNSSVVKNNIDLNTYSGQITHRFVSGNNASNANNYVLTVNDEKIDKAGVTAVGLENINKELFLKANFSNDMWRLNDNISYDNTPIFANEKITDLKAESNKDFMESKITLYNNLMKLMPFYEADEIVELAKSVQDVNLNTKEIAYVLPIDSKGNVITYLTSNDVKKIAKIKIVYKDGFKDLYDVIYDNTYDMVAVYRILNLNLDYTYNHYIIDAKSQIVTDLTNYLQKLDYTESLDTLTATADSRIYRDFYNDVTSKELKEFVLKYLANSNYTNTTSDERISNYLERAVKKNNNIEKVLYMYNYFRRFYDLEIDGMKLYDYMLFRMDDFDKSLTADKITSLFFAKDDNFKTSTTATAYKDIFSKYTKKDNLAMFLEHLVKSFGDGDLNEWTRSQFKGYLVEVPAGENDNVQYTLWDHFINDDTSYSGRIVELILPILTLPKNAAYIVSSPVQFIIGAQRTYIENPDDPNQQKLLRDKIKTYTDRLESYYETAYNILGDETLFNNIHTIHHDKRYAYDENGAKVYQQIGTEEPFHKNFNEVTGRWQTSDGNNAVAWGDRIDWSVAGFLDSTLATDGTLDQGHVTYKTWSHESAHNTDARLFFKNHGRRFDAGGEDYADSFLMQSFSANEIVMNLSINFNEGLQVGSNLTPERINSKAKIHDFYDKVFQTIYVMDYIEAKAFLQLSSEEQKALGIQVSYPNEDLQFAKDSNGNLTGVTYKEDEFAKYRARQTSKFTRLNELDKDIKLNSINDLIDNRIMLYPGVYRYSSRGSNSYGGEGFNTVHWYQPNNPDGRPDSYALKWISYEMLGLKGYDEGFVEYASNINSVKKQIYSSLEKPENGKTTVNYKTDSMALKQITGKYSDFSTYKKDRFKEVEEKLEKLDKIIDVKAYVQKFYDSLKEDAVDMTKGIDDILKKSPNCPSDYWCSRGEFATLLGYRHSNQVRQEIYYALKNKTNDFRSDIYMNTKQQDVKDLTVKKN